MHVNATTGDHSTVQPNVHITTLVYTTHTTNTTHRQTCVVFTRILSRTLSHHSKNFLARFLPNHWLLHPSLSHTTHARQRPPSNLWGLHVLCFYVCVGSVSVPKPSLTLSLHFCNVHRPGIDIYTHNVTVQRHPIRFCTPHFNILYICTHCSQLQNQI